VRILCYAQHLTGVGHFVRMHALACGLNAAGHQVHMVDGGRPVPHARGSSEPQVIRLPPLARLAGKLVALGSTTPVDAVLEERARELAGAVERIRPDAVLIDHYPFSKWELDLEIAATVDAARACNPAVRVLCSLRDIVRQTRYEQAAPCSYAERVLALLRARFDGILVHADPAFTRIEEHFTRCGDLPVAVEYTGFVVRPLPAESATCTGAYGVLSCGGGSGGPAFLRAAMDAFRHLADRGALGAMQLAVFPGPAADDSELRTLEAMAGPFRIRRFRPEFEGDLHRSAFSISRAGYNTCAALLRSRSRAVLVPDPAISDQGFRARRFAQLGLATVVEGNAPDVEGLRAAIEAALAQARPRHGLSVDGVARTRALVETAGAWSGTR
jgi:predicted glycosyltransferase